MTSKLLSVLALSSVMVLGAFDARAQDATNVQNLLPDQGELSAPSAPVVNEAAALDGDIQPDDVFYDADALVPQTEMSRRVPRKIDPITQPASKLIIVKTDHRAGSRQASLVSANRALKLGRYDAALKMFDAMYAKRKKDTNVLMGRAVALQNLGRYNEAIMAYDMVLDIRPDHKDARVNKLGILSQKYPSVALRQLLDMHNDDSDSVGVMAQLALTYAKLGNFSQALAYMGAVASKEPKNPLHVYNMAIIADQAGMREKAIALYEEALELDSIYQGGRMLPRDDVFMRLASLR